MATIKKLKSPAAIKLQKSLAQTAKEVCLHKAGKLKLKRAEELLEELRSL